ncbi:MAG: hypothetical protein IJ157_13195 [Clostridia bacterium]|nr:hypothetical protein [Clostridia bacterium]
MKKLLCCLLALLTLLGVAQADTSLITGEVVEIPNPGDVRVLLGSEGFEASFNDTHLFGSIQPDGSLLVGTREAALRLDPLPDAGLLDELMGRLDREPSYENSVYSSLFTHAQQIELTADEVCALTLRVLGLCPLLDRDGAIRQAVSQPGGQEIWATVTRYTAADISQYPDAMTLQINVFSPVLPAIWIEYYRTDTFGSNFKLAVSREKVTDWDETLLAISEADAGDESHGRMISGFTIQDDSGSEIWIYLEADMMGFSQDWHVEADIYQDSADAASWEAEISVTERGSKTPVAAVSLNSEPTSQEPAPELDAAAVIDCTDGLDEAEWQQLGL